MRNTAKKEPPKRFLLYNVSWEFPGAGFEAVCRGFGAADRSGSAYPQIRYAIRKCSCQYVLLRIDLSVMRT